MCVVTATVLLAAIALAWFFWWYANAQRSVERRRGVPVEHRMAILTALLGLLETAARTAGVRPFLMYGTLLGYVRQRDFICYDFDVDVGVLETDFEALCAALRRALVDHEARFALEHHDVQCLGIRYLSVRCRATDLNLDVFPYRSDCGGGCLVRTVPPWYARFVLRECATRLPRHWILPVTEGRMRGITVGVPNDPHALLRCFYGPSYATPDHVCDARCQRCRRRRASDTDAQTN